MAIVLHRACGTSPEPGNANSVRVTSTRRAGRESDHDARHRGVRDVRARGIGPKRRVEPRWCRGGAEVVRRMAQRLASVDDPPWAGASCRTTQVCQSPAFPCCTGLVARNTANGAGGGHRARARSAWRGPTSSGPGLGGPSRLASRKPPQSSDRISPIVPALHASDGPPLGES